MRKYVIVLIGTITGALSFTSCDHVENPFPVGISTDLDTNLYPGNWSDYVANDWPDFSTLPNDNPNRNALIEDFTGHNCSNCPAAATVAHNLHEGNPSRVFVASVHAGPEIDGAGSFQDVNIAQGYTIDFVNQNGRDLGAFFGVTISGSGFNGNPSGTVSRTLLGTEYFYGSFIWSSQVNNVLGSSLSVAIKAKVNYFDATKGLFLHTEIEKLDGALNYEDLAQVVYLIEDSLVGPQNVSSTFTPDYVHRDIMRGCIDGKTWGRDITDGTLVGGKYQLDYSYVVPNQLAPQGQTGTHNAENMHLLIYVYNKNTYEIYQVIKKKIVP